jgi:predicted nucleic acid-binding protein
MRDKTLVDTSVWITFFRQTDSPVSLKIKNLLRNGQPVYTGVIATELYRGAKTEKEISVLNDLFSSLECLPTTEQDFRGAGHLGHTLAHKGLTMGTVDLLIARIAMTNNSALFSLDSHFAAIARHTDLRLY